MVRVLLINKLTEADDVSQFDCGDEEINSFLKEDAFQHQKDDLAVTYSLKNGEIGKILGYVSLAMGALEMDEDGISPYPQQPAILLARLGVDKGYRGNRYGYQLIDYAVFVALGLKERVGCRYLFTEAYPERVDYYKKKGFQVCPSGREKRKNVVMYIRLEAPEKPEDVQSTLI